MAASTSTSDSVALADSAETDEARRGVRRLAGMAGGWISSPDTLHYLSPEFLDLPVTPKAKACLELGLLRLLGTRVRPDDSGLARVAAAVDAIWADPDFADHVAASPSYSRQYGLIYGALAPPGAHLHRPTLEQVAPGGRLATYGKSPYLRLETRYYADLAGLDHDFESYPVLYRTSLMADLTEPITDSHEAYKVTHTLFHVTDFGRRPIDLTDAERANALRVVDAMTDYFIADEYWDLIAELTLSQHCLGQDPTRTRSGVAGIRSLLAVQTPDGRIPARFAAQRPPETSEPVSLFRFAYHTTLVTTLVSMIAADGD